MIHPLQPSRVASLFEVEIFDWNQIDQAKSLGAASIDLTALEPFQATELSLPLVHSKQGPKGEVRLRLVFNPEIVARSRKSTSTFSMAGRALSHVGTLPFGGIATGVSRGLFKSRKTIDEVEENLGLPVAPPSSHTSQPAALPVVPASGDSTLVPFVTEATPGQVTPPREHGILRIIVVGAKDLAGGQGDSIKPYVVVKLGDKELKTKHTPKTTTPEWYGSQV